MSKSLTTAAFCFLSLLPCMAPAKDAFATRQPRYRLHAGDVITVDYRYTPEYNAAISIQPDGFASLPFLGDMKLGGLTLAEAHDQLLAKASDRLNQPEITIGLKDFEKPYYIVGGEVGSPGRFEIRSRVTALRAIEMAGGFKMSSKASQVLLIRPVSGLDAETKLIDLKKVTDRRDLKEDVELQPGDLLVVPKTRLAKIEPYVRLANFGMYLNPFNM
jgi:polysaccharide export outer membrane protein